MTIPLHEPAPDWTGQTWHDRLRRCANLLHAYELLAQTDRQRMLNRIEARADLQRGDRINAHGPDLRKWSWWATEIADPEDRAETYGINEPTRDAAIAAAMREFGPGAWIAIVEVTQDGPFDARPFAEDGDCRLTERVIEQFMDDNGTRWSQDGDYPELPTQEIAKALNDAFEIQIAANQAALAEAAWSFTETRNAETLLLSELAADHG